MLCEVCIRKFDDMTIPRIAIVPAVQLAGTLYLKKQKVKESILLYVCAIESVTIKRKMAEKNVWCDGLMLKFSSSYLKQQRSNEKRCQVNESTNAAFAKIFQPAMF